MKRLKGHGHGARVRIFLCIRIINLDRNGVIFKPRTINVHILVTMPTELMDSRKYSVCGDMVTVALCVLRKASLLSAHTIN